MPIDVAAGGFSVGSFFIGLAVAVVICVVAVGGWKF